MVLHVDSVIPLAAADNAWGVGVYDLGIVADVIPHLEEVTDFILASTVLPVSICSCMGSESLWMQGVWCWKQVGVSMLGTWQRPATLSYVQGLYLLGLRKNGNSYIVNILILNSHMSFDKKILHGLVQKQRSSKNWDVGLFGECVKKFPLIYKLFLMYGYNFMYGLEPIQRRTKQVDLRSWMN